MILLKQRKQLKIKGGGGGVPLSEEHAIPTWPMGRQGVRHSMVESVSDVSAYCNSPAQGLLGVSLLVGSCSMSGGCGVGGRVS